MRDERYGALGVDAPEGMRNKTPNLRQADDVYTRWRRCSKETSLLAPITGLPLFLGGVG